MRIFAPQGRHVAPMGVKFGTEEGTEIPLLRAKFHPYRCYDKGIGPLKLKFLLIFGQNVEYKRPQGRIPCAIFTNLQNLYLVSKCVSGYSFVKFSQGVMELWAF